MTGIVIGVDASRNRSGGAIAHLRGLFAQGDPRNYGVREVHVWSYQALLDLLPDAEWLVKHNPPELQRSLPRQVWWQYRSLPGELRRAGCDLLFSTDAGTVCNFVPSVVMSQDMLSYEPREMRRSGLSLSWLRLVLLRLVQTRSMRGATGVIFLTQYASETIQKVTGSLRRHDVVPLGVDDAFRRSGPARTWPLAGGSRIECVYVSNALMYKHQWQVVKAVGELRARGHDLSLLLAGGGSGRPQALLDAEIARTDPQRQFVSTRSFLPHAEIPKVLAAADLFVFASSCESMPVTLVEAMASGLPIACSNRGPMPGILEDGGTYFDPEDPISIAAAIESIVVDPHLRDRIAQRARTLADRYSWKRCAHETWMFLVATLQGGHSSGASHSASDAHDREMHV